MLRLATLGNDGKLDPSQVPSSGGSGGSLTVVSKAAGAYAASNGDLVVFTGFSISDGNTTSGSPTLTADSAEFTNALVGAPLDDQFYNASIPLGTTVLSVESPTSLTMSDTATATAGSDQIAFGLVVELPAPTSGHRVQVKRAVSGGFGGFPYFDLGGRALIVPTSGTIDLLSSWELAGVNEAVDLVADGTNWHPVGAFSLSRNWCYVTFSGLPPLTAGAPAHNVAASEMSIAAQSGTDFSLVPPGGDAGIISAKGGRFQVACTAVAPNAGTPSIVLDGTNTQQRWVSIAALLGNDEAEYPTGSLGMDVLVPVLTYEDGNVLNTAASAVGYAEPGGTAINEIRIRANGLAGTDSIPAGAVIGGNTLVVYEI